MIIVLNFFLLFCYFDLQDSIKHIFRYLGVAVKRLQSNDSKVEC